jgi:hypothetical protein
MQIGIDPTARGMAAGAASYATQAQSYAAAAEVSKDAAAASESDAAASAAEAQAAVQSIAVLPGFYNLKANTTSNNVAVAADYAVLRNSSGTTKTLFDIDIDLDVTIGTTLLDDGSTATANDTWYKVWLTYNPTTEIKQLILSTESTTAPTLPSGYTHYVFVMCIRGTGGNLYHLIKRDKKVQYVVDGTILTALLTIASGVQGTFSGSTFTPVTTSMLGFVPTTATKIKLFTGINAATGCNIGVAPNANFSGVVTSNPPPITVSFVANESFMSDLGDMMLESTNIYCAITASNGFVKIFGWTDNL